MFIKEWDPHQFASAIFFWKRIRCQSTDPKIAADLHQSVDGSAVRTSLVGICEAVFWCARYPSCDPTNNAKTLKATEGQ